MTFRDVKETDTICCSTMGFLMMASNSVGRSRSFGVAERRTLQEKLDGDGVHVLVRHFMHNGSEWRCHWFCKFKGTDEPVSIWMDVGFKSFSKNTWKDYVQVEEGSDE